jgi:hypothetical protein
VQWPLTSQLHGSVSQREQLFFSLRIKLHARISILSNRRAGQIATTVSINKFQHNFKLYELLIFFNYTLLQFLWDVMAEHEILYIYIYLYINPKLLLFSVVLHFDWDILALDSGPTVAI